MHNWSLMINSVCINCKNTCKYIHPGVDIRLLIVFGSLLYLHKVNMDMNKTIWISQKYCTIDISLVIKISIILSSFMINVRNIWKIDLFVNFLFSFRHEDSKHEDRRSYRDDR